MGGVLGINFFCIASLTIALYWIQIAHAHSAARRRGFKLEGRFKVFVLVFSTVLIFVTVSLRR